MAEIDAFGRERTPGTGDLDAAFPYVSAVVQESLRWVYAGNTGLALSARSHRAATCEKVWLLAMGLTQPAVEQLEQGAAQIDPARCHRCRIYPPAPIAVRESKGGMVLGDYAIPGDAALQVRQPWGGEDVTVLHPCARARAGGGARAGAAHAAGSPTGRALQCMHNKTAVLGVAGQHHQHAYPPELLEGA